MRRTGEPALMVFQVERLTSHTNADDQTVYRNVDDIEEATLNGDPILIAKQHLLGLGLTESELSIMETQVESACSNDGS